MNFHGYQVATGNISGTAQVQIQIRAHGDVVKFDFGCEDVIIAPHVQRTIRDVTLRLNVTFRMWVSEDLIVAPYFRPTA